MVRHSRIGDCVYLLALLLTITSALPLSANQGQLTDESDELHISARSLHDSDESQELLQAKRNILERMLKETNEKLSNSNGNVVSKKSLGHDIVSRFTDHGPSARRPAKKSSLVSDDSELEDNQLTSEEIEKLSMLLAMLEEKNHEVETTTKSTTSKLPFSPSLASLYQKLSDLDIDLLELLQRTEDKREGPREGPYPKEFIKK